MGLCASITREKRFSQIIDKEIENDEIEEHRLIRILLLGKLSLLCKELTVLSNVHR